MVILGRVLFMIETIVILIVVITVVVGLALWLDEESDD